MIGGAQRLCLKVTLADDISQLVLVWTPGKGSPIHDHGNAHCLMKILRGNLTETRYAFPEGETSEGPMTIISEKTYKEDAVAYMADELGLHRVSNKGSDFAVSLHRRCLASHRDTSPHADLQLCSIHPSKRSQGGLSHLRREDGQEEPRARLPLLLSVWPPVEAVGSRGSDSVEERCLQVRRLSNCFSHVAFPFLSPLGPLGQLEPGEPGGCLLQKRWSQGMAGRQEEERRFLAMNV